MAQLPRVSGEAELTPFDVPFRVSIHFTGLPKMSYQLVGNESLNVVVEGESKELTFPFHKIKWSPHHVFCLPCAKIVSRSELVEHKQDSGHLRDRTWPPPDRVVRRVKGKWIKLMEDQRNKDGRRT
jgi:hypothetical protein